MNSLAIYAFGVLALCANAASAASANLRAIHSIVGGPSYDIYAEKTKVFSGLSYSNITSYAALAPKFYRVTVQEAGTSNVVASTSFVLSEGEFFTVAIVGQASQQHVEIHRFIDDFSAPPVGTTQLNFIQLSYNTPAVNFMVNGSALFSQVTFGTSSDFIETNAGLYEFSLINPATNKQIVGPIDFNFASMKCYSVVLFGILGSGNYPLQAVTLLDQSYA